MPIDSAAAQPRGRYEVESVTTTTRSPMTRAYWALTPAGLCPPFHSRPGSGASYQRLVVVVIVIVIVVVIIIVVIIIRVRRERRSLDGRRGR